MGAFKLNLCKVLKIIFISVLLVRSSTQIISKSQNQIVTRLFVHDEGQEREEGGASLFIFS